MKPIWPQSLEGRVVAVVLIATFFALTVAMAALAIYDARAYRDAVTADLTTQAEILGRTNVPALTFDDVQAAQENIALMRVRPTMNSVALYKPDGRLFASYGRDTFGVMPSQTLVDSAGTRIDGQEIVLVQPIIESREKVGTIVLRASYEWQQRLASYFVILITVMVASLGIALLVTSFLQARITKPILSITGVARKVVDEGDFSLRVDRTGTREMDVLVDAFNRMLIEVGEQTEALAASNRFLESEMAVRRRAEEALRAADKNKDQFLATLAHELRNPLAPLLNGVAILRLPSRTEAESAKVVSMMERQVKQMVRLIDDLLDVSRIATNKLVLRMAPMDLRDAANAAVETLAPFIRDRRHTLHVDVPSTPVPIIADSTRLAQVFANLLHNAAKFTEPGKEIRLTVSSTPEGIRVVVKDNGIGFEPSMATKIFQLFEQADQSLERVQAGLGVGLTLARRLVELHGGTLEARSEGRGRGSEFVVALPATNPAVPQADTAPTGRGNQLLSRVLIVDDNVDFALSLSTLIRTYGSEVRVANDGMDGLAKAKEFLPQIAFLDIGMPKLNGYDLARRLRQLPGLENCVLVAVSGWGQAEDRRRAQEAGFDHHLVKPVERDQLAQLLGGPRSPA